MKIYLHMGLHKTATKFFQHKVFSYLSDYDTDIIYNPPKLVQYAMDYRKALTKEDKLIAKNYFNKEKKKLEQKYTRTIISREIFSGNLFSGYNDWEESCKSIKELFDDVEIILFFRFQADWIVSCYKESIHEHHYQTFEEFIGFKKTNINSSFAHIDIKTLNYANMLETLFKYIEKDSVNIFFYEDFKVNKKNVLENVLNIIKLDDDIKNELLKKIDYANIPNRGYSKLGIRLSLLRYKIFKILGLGFLIHRPIFFFGEKSIPAGLENLSCLNKETYWGDYYRDNEEIREKNYPNISILSKIKREFTWRFFIKHRLDKIYYESYVIDKNTDKVLNNYFKLSNDQLETYDLNLPKEYKI